MCGTFHVFFTELLKYEKFVYKDIYYNDMYFIQEFE